MSAVEDLVREGRIEAVPPDLDASRTKLDEAQRHLRSADLIGSHDPEGAYALVYDAARKAVDAHMSAKGYRASRSRPGAHETVGRYACAVIAGDYSADATAFDRMRKHRNRIEYGTWMVPAATLAKDRAHAERLVEAVEIDLRLREP